MTDTVLGSHRPSERIETRVAVRDIATILTELHALRLFVEHVADMDPDVLRGWKAGGQVASEVIAEARAMVGK